VQKTLDAFAGQLVGEAALLRLSHVRYARVEAAEENRRSDMDDFASFRPVCGDSPDESDMNSV
jgi:hypothetical protein